MKRLLCPFFQAISLDIKLHRNVVKVAFEKVKLLNWGTLQIFLYAPSRYVHSRKLPSRPLLAAVEGNQQKLSFKMVYFWSWYFTMQEQHLLHTFLYYVSWEMCRMIVTDKTNMKIWALSHYTTSNNWISLILHFLPWNLLQSTNMLAVG